MEVTLLKLLDLTPPDRSDPRDALRLPDTRTRCEAEPTGETSLYPGNTLASCEYTIPASLFCRGGIKGSAAVVVRSASG